MQGWYDLKDGREVVGIRTFSLIHKGVNIFGLCGLDRLLCFMIVHDLTNFCKTYRRVLNKNVLGFVHKVRVQALNAHARARGFSVAT